MVLDLGLWFWIRGFLGLGAEALVLEPLYCGFGCELSWFWILGLGLGSWFGIRGLGFGSAGLGFGSAGLGFGSLF